MPLLKRLDRKSAASREAQVSAKGIRISDPPWDDFATRDWKLFLDPVSRTFDEDDAVRSDGIGIPVVLARDNDPELDLDRHRPPEGIFRSATAVLDVDDQGKFVRFLDPLEVTHYRSEPLAYDLTNAWGMLIDRAGKLARSGRKLMLNPAKATRETKIYVLDPYDPNRIPLLMVHGLQSTPVAWAELVNALRADPVVRAHYQIWQFHYPTGAPVLHHAKKLRLELEETLQLLDPEGDDPATSNVVVVGHSMGGVISHTLVAQSGSSMWDAFATRPLEELNTPKEMRELLRGNFFFEPHPSVRRVVFIASPHRGAAMADSFIGDVGNLLAKPEDIFHEVAPSALEAANPGAIRQEILDHYGDRKLTSIRTLSKNGTLLGTLADLPPVVPVHSIIGQKKVGPKEEGTDGIVDYESAHFPLAQSEVIVRSTPNGAIKHPVSVRELTRMLRRHLTAGSPPTRKTIVSQ